MRKINRFLVFTAFLSTVTGGSYLIAKAESSVDVEYDKTQWEWNELESGYTARATLVFSNNSTISLDASVSEKVINEKTCEKNGLLRYTATIVYGGVTLENNKDIVIEADGHVFSEYQYDDDFHYSSCKCGEINDKHNHNFGEYIVVEAPDGWKTPGRKYKECEDCKYRHYETITSTATYREQIIARTKEALDNFGDLPEVEDSKKIFNDVDVHEIYEYLTSDEILSLEEPYLRKLLSIIFDYNKVVDVDQNGRLIYMSGDSNVAINGVEENEIYGNLATIDIKTKIANRKEFLGINTYSRYGASKYTFFQFSNVPQLFDKDKEMVLYVNAPYAATVAISCDSALVGKFIYNSSGSPVGTNYLKYDSSKADSDESKGYINLVKGWNTVVFDENCLTDFKQRKPHKMQLEIIDEEGLNPGMWKFSSFITKGVETYSLVEKANNLPELGNVKVYDGTLINDLYSSYLSLSSDIDNIYHLKNKLIKLKVEWESFASLPYGTYKMQSDVDPKLYDTQKGKCYRFVFDQTTYNKGILHLGGGVKTIASPFDCLGFYIKGYDGRLSIYNSSSGKNIISFNRVGLDDGWSLYFLTKDVVTELQSYNLNSISWGYLYLHFDDPIASGVLYNSPIYSFAANSNIYNEIVSALPESDDDLRYSDKEIIDTAFFLLEEMSGAELKKCNDVERITRLHNNFPIKGVTFEEAKAQLTLSSGTKYDWGHFNGKAVYYNLSNCVKANLTLSLPEISYKYYSNFTFQGEMSQGILIGFSADDHYVQPKGDGVDEFFTISITTITGKTSVNIKVFAKDSDTSKTVDTRSYETFSDVIYDETRDITDANILSGDSSLQLFVQVQHTWNTKFFIGAASMEAK